MTHFVTEFPVDSGFDRARFVAEVQAWLKGNPNSSIGSDEAIFELDSDSGQFIGNNDESLSFRHLATGDMDAVGFRHDIHDDQGRTWRTEAVLLKNPDNIPSVVLRLRTQCRARWLGANLLDPKKPFLINALLNYNWGGLDGEFTVSGEPIWLSDDNSGLEVAVSILTGRGIKYLPAIYLSTKNDNYTVVDKEQIERLAYRLGGMAHVLVEPSRSFSFKLKAATGGRNAYAGAVGLALPARGLVARYQAGLHFEDNRSLLQLLTSATALAKSQVPMVGWEWTDLNERALREQAKLVTKSANNVAIDEIFDEMAHQIEELNDQKNALEVELIRSKSERLAATAEFGASSVLIASGEVSELYDGELNDRIRLAVSIALDMAESRGLDNRTRSVFKKILSIVPVSPGLLELNEAIGRATRDPKRVTDEVCDLLESHGYMRKSENKHVKLEPIDGFEGLESITLSKTPSEYRGLKNIAAQVRRSLGLNVLEK